MTMEKYMKANGKMINEMEKEYINFQMVMHIKAIGKKTKEMVME